MKYILDASVALKWVLPEPLAAKARQLRDDYQKRLHELFAPDCRHRAGTGPPSCPTRRDSSGGAPWGGGAEAPAAPGCVAPLDSNGNMGIVEVNLWA